MKRMVLLSFLVLSLVAVQVSTPVASASAKPASGSTGYWCPPYSWYCSSNSQCRGYCGPGTPPEWEVCEFGCCACLG